MAIQRNSITTSQKLTLAMDRYSDGDDGAFSEIYDLLEPRLSSFFLRRTRDRCWAEDLVQQTLLQIHRARQSFVRGSDAIPWVFAIGPRLLIDSLRRTRTDVLFNSVEHDQAAPDARISRDSNPDEVASTIEMSERLGTAIERLPEPQRAAYHLVRDDGLSAAAPWKQARE